MGVVEGEVYGLYVFVGVGDYYLCVVGFVDVGLGGELEWFYWDFVVVLM